jgi:hypothetical protein
VTGVVDQEVDRAELARDRLDQARDVLRLRDVSLEGG